MFSKQLGHVVWEGFHFYNLISPLFVFLSGVSLAIALPRRLEREGPDFKRGFPKTSFNCQSQCLMHLITCSRRIVHPVSERLNLQIRDACYAGQPIVVGNKKLAAFRHRTGQLDGVGRT